MTITDRQRKQRIAAAWATEPDADLDTISAAVDEAIAAEADERAEAEAETKKMTDSMTRMMFTCGACGGTRLHTVTDGLCAECRGVMAQVLAERHGADVVRDGHTRRECVAAYLDAKATR